MEPPRSERHKGARGTMGAVSPWAPGARSGDSALRGGGRSSRGRARGSPPPRPLPAPAPTPAWMLQPLSRPSALEPPPPPRSRLDPPHTYLGHELCTLLSGPAPSLGATWGAGERRAGSGGRARRAWPGRPAESLGARAGAVYFPLSLCVSVRCALA